MQSVVAAGTVPDYGTLLMLSARYVGQPFAGSSLPKLLLGPRLFPEGKIQSLRLTSLHPYIRTLVSLKSPCVGRDSIAISPQVVRKPKFPCVIAENGHSVSCPSPFSRNKDTVEKVAFIVLHRPDNRAGGKPHAASHA